MYGKNKEILETKERPTGILIDLKIMSLFSVKVVTRTMSISVSLLTINLMFYKG